MSPADLTPERALVERYLAAYNAFDVAGMLAVLAPDVRFEHHADGAPAFATDGIDAFRTLAEQAVQLFAARAQRIVAWEQGEADGRATASAAIAWRGRPAADPDTELALDGRSEFTFADGRIARIVDRA